MFFCGKNCSDLLGEKIVLVIEKNFWNLRLKAMYLQKWLRLLEQCIQTMKGQNNFWCRNLKKKFKKLFVWILIVFFFSWNFRCSLVCKSFNIWLHWICRMPDCSAYFFTFMPSRIWIRTILFDFDWHFKFICSNDICCCM